MLNGIPPEKLVRIPAWARDAWPHVSGSHEPIPDEEYFGGFIDPAAELERHLGLLRQRIVSARDHLRYKARRAGEQAEYLSELLERSRVSDAP